MKGEMKISPDKERISPIMYQGLEDDFKKNNLKNRRLAKTDDFLTADGSYRSSKTEYVPRISWSNLIGLLFVHIGGLYGFYLIFVEAKLSTILWMFITTYTTGFGITAGVHRLWSHRAYKAKWPLRLLLIFLFTITGQKDVYRWALDHRVHHKYSETDADPHNVKRGFFFAHVGWLFITPHPDVVSKRKAVDMSDLEADQLVMWQKRYYILLFPLLTIGFPVVVPWYFWSESIWTSFWMNFNCRFCITLNIAFFVNSVAHMWGKRPYDKYISSVENTMLSIAALGEGWHNFHHVFPWDYKTGELGNYTFNLTTGFIDTFARFGWAYDRKYVSPAMVRRRAKRSGDGSHIWGYGDADISAEDLQELELMDKIKQIMNERKQKVKWIAILWYIYIHVLGVYAIWLMFTSAKWMTIFYTIFITAIGYFGMTAGAHRLWAHRTYESESLVKLFLMLAHTSTGVGSIYNWVLYHRIHHKYYGTDKDPYNHKKGFLYSHYLSNILSPNMNLEEMKRRIDLSDIENDIYVYFQKIFYWPLFLIFGLILPLNAPLEYWNESLIETILITGFLRFAIIINISWLMNSAFLVWNIKEGEKLIHISDTISLLYKLFFKMPQSHGTVIIDNNGIHIK